MKFDLENVADGGTIERFRPSASPVRAKQAWGEVAASPSKVAALTHAGLPELPNNGFGNCEIAWQWMPSHTKLLGQAQRNAITGEINVFQVDNFSNFTVVDLLNRQSLPSRPAELARDIFLFKPVPMKYRTWLFHCLHTGLMPLRQKGHGHGRDKAVIKEALEVSCLDNIKISGGRWSPLMLNVIMGMTTSLTGNTLLVCAAMIHNFVVAAICLFLNSPMAYKWVRVVTLPVRLSFLILLVLMFPVNSSLAVVGSILSLLVIVADLVGDIQAVLNIRNWCTYTVIKFLSSDVFVCERAGGDALGEALPQDASVDVAVAGTIPWKRHHTLICDVEGLLMELVPMKRIDWLTLVEEVEQTMDVIPFASLDIGMRWDADEGRVVKTGRAPNSMQSNRESWADTARNDSKVNPSKSMNDTFFRSNMPASKSTTSAHG